MNITSAKFVKGMGSVEDSYEAGIPHIAFIGRSNVGKSSTINLLTKTKGLAKTSSFPGRTTEINLFLINNKFYFVDLPGYGYAKASASNRAKLRELINAYFFDSHHSQEKVVLIIDALVGPTADDIEMLEALEKYKKTIIVAVNKIDKVKPSQKVKQLKAIQEAIGPHMVVPYSAEKKIGITELLNAILE